MLFGDPIYVRENMTDEEVEQVRKQIEDNLNGMYKDLKENFKDNLGATLYKNVEKKSTGPEQVGPS